MSSDALDALVKALAEHGGVGETRRQLEDTNLSMTGKQAGDMAKGSGAGLAGLPVDLVSALIRALGYDTPPEQTVGSSEWFGKKMGADPESGAFITGTMMSPDPMDAMKLAGLAPALAKRMSKAEAEAAGLWHEIGTNTKLKKPVGEMTRETTPHGVMEEKRIITPESMQGSILIPAPGDRSDAGKLLTGVGGKDLDSPVALEGGHGFMRANPESIWASDKGPITSLNKKAREALDKGKDPNLVFMPMGHGSADHNMMVTDILMDQVKTGKVAKVAKKKFDEALRKKRPEWKGIDTKAGQEQLTKNGELRKHFTRIMGMNDFQKMGFPDVAEARFAVTDPDLLDYAKTPLHQGGQSISRMSGNVIDDPQMTHRTYPQQAGGEYKGGLEQSVPREVMFSDFYNERRAAGAPPQSDYRSFSLGLPTQEADQQWVDNMMEYMRTQRQ